MRHRVKNTAAGFVEFIVQFVNTIIRFYPGTVLAGMVIHQDIPVLVVLMTVAFDQAIWHSSPSLAGNILQLAMWGISEDFTVNSAQTLIEALPLI